MRNTYTESGSGTPPPAIAILSYYHHHLIIQQRSQKRSSRPREPRNLIDFGSGSLSQVGSLARSTAFAQRARSTHTHIIIMLVTE